MFRPLLLLLLRQHVVLGVSVQLAATPHPLTWCMMKLPPQVPHNLHIHVG
jgi:hypothetical protein